MFFDLKKSNNYNKIIISVKDIQTIEELQTFINFSVEDAKKFFLDTERNFFDGSTIFMRFDL